MSKKILVVDDESGFVNLMTSFLQEKGYEVISAVDSFYGLLRAKKDLPDLMLMDMAMPAGGGVSLLKNLRMNFKTSDLPVVVVTGTGNYKTKEDVEKLNISGYLEKPVSMNDLMGVIESVFTPNKK